MPSLTTLNTWKCDGRYTDRLGLMTGALCRMRPDILLLQEAFAAPAADAGTAEHLAAALGYALAAVPARAKRRSLDGRWLDSTSGLAVLTRGTIRDSRAVPLPAPEADGERVSQIAEIELDGARLLIVNVHLTYLPEEDGTRRREIADTLAALPDISGFDATLMAGDFNCPPDSAPMRWLMTDSGFDVTDPCLAEGKEFVTHVAQPDLGRPAQRIDYALQIERPDAPSALSIGQVARVLDAPDPVLGITPSDHYGVSVTLRRRK